MKKLFILLSILFSVSSFSVECYYPGSVYMTGTSFGNYFQDGALATDLSECKSKYDYHLTDKSAVGQYAKVAIASYTGPYGGLVLCKGNLYNRAEPITCPTGYALNSSCTCVLPNLPDYNDDPYECVKHGGFPTGHPVNASGVSFMDSGFSIKWERKCLTKDQAITDTIPLIAGVTGNISGNPDLLGILFDKGVKKIKDIWNDLFSQGKPITNDYLISLPKYNPTSKTYEAEIIESPIPKGSDGVTPSRSPNIGSDPYQQFLRDEYFPKNNLDSSGNPVINMAQVDNFNTSNQIFKDNGTDPKIYTFTPNTSNIWGSTSGTPSSRPIYDTVQMVSSKPAFTPKATIDAPTFRIAPPDSTFYPPVPVKVTDVNVNSTVGTTSIAGTPVKQWINTMYYPDGSSAREVVSIDETNKKGTRTTTTVAPNGSTSSTTESFDIPNYVPGSPDPLHYDVVKNAPVTTGQTTVNSPTVTSTPVIDPITGFPIESNPFPLSSAPTTATGQDIINAPMPNYSLPNTPEFIPFDSNPITQMIDSASQMFSNIEQQIASTKTVFDNTKLMLEGGWTPPTIPAGSCGDSMAFDFHGRHIDLCPPLANSTAVASPIISSVVTIGGMAFAVSIFFGGF